VRRKRPFGVTVVAIIVALSAPANGVLVAIERWRFFAPLGHREIEVGTVAAVITILGIAIAIGLWRLKHWAWVAAMLWTGSMLAAGLVLDHAGEHPIVTLLCGIAIVFYLNHREVQRAFVY
jgi:hypothetical protein